MLIGSLHIDPIDCVSDLCHLAWLIRYNRNLLPAVSDGFCSNGTRFEDLNQSAYANCPVCQYLQIHCFKLGFHYFNVL